MQHAVPLSHGKVAGLLLHSALHASVARDQHDLKPGAPEMALYMGGGPHTSTRLSSDGGGMCSFSTSAVMCPTPARVAVV